MQEINESNNQALTIETGMEYNTQRNKIVLSQYGRNIHKLIHFALTIEDKEQRNQAAEHIVATMEILNPKIKTIENYKKVLWNHLAMMSNYQLDVDYPCEIIAETDLRLKPEKIVLIKNHIKKRQYGRIIEEMIKTATTIPDEDLRREVVEIILIQMKKTYIEWNKDIISDNVIFNDFLVLCNNQLGIPENFKLPQSYEYKNRINTNQSIQMTQPMSHLKRLNKK